MGWNKCVQPLFAREAKPDWQCWGDQAGLFDSGTVRTRRQPSRLVDDDLSALGLEA